MKVRNAMEILVEEALNYYWKQLELPCKCDLCKTDVYAITLNQLPPRYVSNENGYAYVKAQNFNDQSRINILNEIVKATGKVAVQPSHPLSRPSEDHHPSEE
ncbi:late competence development ComFB family protein [Fictibacillus sp. WQ 8-8]|uniref:Late competence development ComFB family protein n=1 Tax=Fictibacillus marinisediminis TaxID=2878389 RepID=A0A9X2BEY4_9BACL|nr:MULTISPECIES: late competence development ComFB family protein [Fictibacillus]SFE05277.1 competence protein ComFB [Bacillus sp. OV194]MCK6256647.1 late competence development ComFB family protein [Fictibacillus marinisediminis]MCQ6265438.1 late competence development ComFB family protein [Fictibacillus sp. WQ 8-8]MED2973661.1 late competence development ComFB family protein [Fictibacillus sp. B-59209]UZJ77478.1 late competence development ComFB family protein [Fictibacillus sp. KU28468]